MSGDGGPEPGALAALEPARLVGVHDWLLAHRARDLFDRRLYGLARRLLHVGDAPQRDGHAEEVLDQLLDPALAHPVGATAHGHNGLEARPEVAGRYPGGSVARVEMQHLGQSSAWSRYSSTVAAAFGTSIT